MQSITLVFRSTQDAENALEEYFADTNELYMVTLDRKQGTIELSGWVGQLNLEIPENCISIIF